MKFGSLPFAIKMSVRTNQLHLLNSSCLCRIINILSTELSRSVWKNLDFGRMYRLHCVRSVLTTSVNWDSSIRTYTMLYKYGKRTSEFLGPVFYSFWGVFNKTIIPLALVEYEMIISNSAPLVGFLPSDLLNNPSAMFARARLVWPSHVTEDSFYLNLGNIRMIFPNFQNTITTIGGQKYARIFVLGHYPCLKAHSFRPWTTLSENCSLLGTDNVRGQISEHILHTKWKQLFISNPRSWNNC